MLPYYIGEHQPRQKNNNFESARELLMEAFEKLAEKRRFERRGKR